MGGLAELEPERLVPAVDAVLPEGTEGSDARTRPHHDHRSPHVLRHVERMRPEGGRS